MNSIPFCWDTMKYLEYSEYVTHSPVVVINSARRIPNHPLLQALVQWIAWHMCWGCHLARKTARHLNLKRWRRDDGNYKINPQKYKLAAAQWRAGNLAVSFKTFHYFIIPLIFCWRRYPRQIIRNYNFCFLFVSENTCLHGAVCVQ